MDRQDVGSHIRQIRIAKGLSQAELARRLEISGTYLNLLEKGRRNFQFPLLLRALEILSVDLEGFMSSVGDAKPDDALAKLLDDPLAKTLELNDRDLVHISAEPRVATTIAALFHLYKNTRAQLDTAVSRLESDPPSPVGYAPGDEVSDFLQSKQNYFPELEHEVDSIRQRFSLPRRFVSEQLMDVMRREFDMDVEIAPPSQHNSVVRNFDVANRSLRLTSTLDENSLKFQLGHVIGLLLLDDDDRRARLLGNAQFRHRETPQLIKIHLANYFAGAMLLPYGDFFEQAQKTRYDVERIASLFESSYETVAHRMCNLADPKRPGVPLHFMRVDVAGNISKRYAADGLRFPQGHGSCPKLAVHAAFLTPAVITKQYVRYPDGATFFCFSKVIAEPQAGSLVRGTIYSIGLGCQDKHASKFVYADDLPSPERTAPVDVGLTCRFCERTDCNQRAAPSYRFAFSVDEYIKKQNFFSPLTEGDVASTE